MAGEVRRLTRPHDPAEALVGARLRAARQAAGLTLAVVAEQAGLTKGFLSRLERDEVSPSVASLVSVCGVLGIGVGQLFEPPATSLVRAADAPPIHFGGRGLRRGPPPGPPQGLRRVMWPRCPPDPPRHTTSPRHRFATAIPPCRVSLCATDVVWETTRL